LQFPKSLPEFHGQSITVALPFYGMAAYIGSAWPIHGFASGSLEWQSPQLSPSSVSQGSIWASSGHRKLLPATVAGAMWLFICIKLFSLTRQGHRLHTIPNNRAPQAGPYAQREDPSPCRQCAWSIKLPDYYLPAIIQPHFVRLSMAVADHDTARTTAPPAHTDRWKRTGLPVAVKCLHIASPRGAKGRSRMTPG